MASPEWKQMGLDLREFQTDTSILRIKSGPD